MIIIPIITKKLLDKIFFNSKNKNFDENKMIKSNIKVGFQKKIINLITHNKLI